MNHLCRSYEKYYQNPRYWGKQLWQDILEYDYCDYDEFCNDILSLRRSIESGHKDCLMLKTGGSLGTRREYAFGPQPHSWLSNVEKRLKFPFRTENVKSFWITGGFPNWRKYPAIHKEQPFGPYTNAILQNETMMQDCIRLYENIIEEFGLVHLVARPEKFLFLLSHQEFVERVLNKLGSKIVSLINTDGPPFFNSKVLSQYNIFFNDQMINWETGVNFYTCRNGHKHFLPIFVYHQYQSTNLLNLCNTSMVETDDFVSIEPTIIKCQCGVNRLRIDFIGHCKNCPVINGNAFIDLSIAESLTSNAINLQFVQNENVINIYCIEINDTDKNFLDSYWQKLGLTVQFHEDWFATSKAERKIPHFWRGNDLIYRKFKPRRILI